MVSNWVKTRYFKTDLNLITLVWLSTTYLCGFYGLYLAISGYTDWKTIVYHLICSYFAIIGTLIGAHRLWSHRSFEANKTIRIILIFWETYIGHNSVYKWVRDHRVHHKYVDSDADPYNVNRGLFFAQIGWYAMSKTQQFRDKDDILNDSLVMFQESHYFKLLFLQWALSAMVPCYFWNESYFVSISTLWSAYALINVHVGTINSLSHWYGWKPYDTGIEPTFSRLVTYLTLGEGYHNFHHTFPQDYSQSELKWRDNFNVNGLIIDFWEHMGWVSNKREANPDLIAKRRQRTGDIKVKIAPCNNILDQILGVICFTWALWLIFAIRAKI